MPFSVVLLCVQVKLQLSECQDQLDLAQKEAQAHKEELTQVTLLIQIASPYSTCTLTDVRHVLIGGNPYQGNQVTGERARQWRGYVIFDYQ